MLTDARISQTGAWLHLPEHRVQLAPHDREQWAIFKTLLDATPYNPPRVRDVALSTGIAEDTVRAVMKRVARTEKSIRSHMTIISPHMRGVADSTTQVAELCRDEGMARAANLRDQIGGGRKVAIRDPADRIGYIRRVRDTHVLRNVDGKSTLAFS